MIERILNPKGYASVEEVEDALARCSSVVKLLCGSANNATQYVILNAHDKMKKHPAYRQQVKKQFLVAIKEWKDYESKLLHSENPRFFCMADMTENTRKKYGDITDREYFEYWQAAGGQVYANTKSLISSLSNKYRLSLIRHGIEYPDLLGEAMAAQATLELCHEMWKKTISQCADRYGFTVKTLSFVFRAFDVKRVSRAWFKAIDMVDERVKEYELDPGEARNIELGLEQLSEAWADVHTIYGSLSEATEDFGDIFRTKGEKAKALREIAEASA